MRRLMATGLALSLLSGGCGLWRDDDGRRVGQRDDGDHVLLIDRGDRDEARLAVVSGANAVTVRTDEFDGLARISTPENSGLVPFVDDSLNVSLEDRGGGGPKSVEIVLNREVAWQLRFSGGANSTVVDLGAGRVSSVDLTAGSNHIELVLPRPAGSVPIRMTGGASQFLVRAPDGVPVRVMANGGASSVVLDGRRHSGASGGAVFSSGDWDNARDRYDIDNTAGVSAFELTRG